MGEEFEESDVIFSDEYDSSSSNECNLSSRDRAGLPGSKVRKLRKVKQKSGSVPIRIPRKFSSGSSTDSDEYGDEEGEYGSVTPPHLIVARRIEERMAFSVKGGFGRPLKGRELSEVRNSILRMTGFLET